MKEIRRLEKELRELEQGVKFLDDSKTRMENILGDLGQVSHCNMYANYRTLKMEVQDAIDHFYNVMKSQMASTAQRLKTEYESAAASSQQR